MPVKLNPKEIYNPVNFIKAHLPEILPEGSSIKDINFDGFITKAFHSGDRPSGTLNITYVTDSAEKTLRLFVKQHPDAEKVFEQMTFIYYRMASCNLGAHMPKPLVCDKLNNVNYMEFIEGTALIYKLFRDLLLHKNKQLNGLFNLIGRWLKHFHEASALEKTTTHQELKAQIGIALNTTTYFSATEKEKLNRRVKELRIYNTCLPMVKPHNDFAMRNVIYTSTRNFIIIDWDAMFHEKFSSESSVWNDITSFFISINSLLRFSPLISARAIKKLSNSFIEGYFYNMKHPCRNKDVLNQLYLFTLSFYLGVIGDRPLPEIYKGKFGYRYMKKLRHALLKGF